MRLSAPREEPLFSESFQYLEPGRGLAGAAALLNEGGHVLLCDFFKLPSEERSPIGGGRVFSEFEEEEDWEEF